MYEEHPTFIQPKDESIKVWRYMDFTKLVSILDTHSLFFTRADKFSDPFEGSWPKINIEARKQIPPDIPLDQQSKYLETANNISNVFKKWPQYIAINCWHINAFESAAMWRLYLASSEGVAIQSTYAKLKDSFTDAESIFLGVVKYIDYDTEFIDAGNIFNAFVHKRKSFEHEQEIRALVSKWPNSKEGVLDFSLGSIKNGLKISVDVEKLIEKIYVAPNAPQWFTDLVSSVISKYGFGIQVEQSKLNESPLF